ncbi:Uma2 family endonuclease [Sorangium sp. So ce1000]|uniref:Uma2 family endonuclease n=1 Tax=Sorangium sp. So ce1000 TaxID=3133325 RepID=UPI003F614BF9
MSDWARRATYQDVLDTPPNQVAEVLNGVLHATPRPSLSCRNVTSVLAGELYLPFRRGIKGPGRWALLVEPELHLGTDPDIVIPDIAAWRRDRMPQIPMRTAAIFLAPDWVCEVISPSTEALDRRDKMEIYARELVAHYWLIDPRHRVLEAYRVDGGRFVRTGAWEGDVTVRAAPFDAVEIELGVLWQE